MLNRIFTLLFSIFTIVWISRIIFSVHLDYHDIVHGGYVFYSFLCMLISGIFSLAACMYIFFKEKYHYIIIIGINFFLFVIESGDLIAMNQI